jgi:putative ABC transport system permease protein
MRDTWLDLRHAARSLRRAPLFTAIAVLTLALGIGANSAIFSVVNAVLLDPFTVPRLDRLAFIEMRSDQGYDISISIPNTRDLLDGARVFEAAGASRGSGATLSGELPERITTEQVYGDFFGALGVAPLVGRALAARETERGAEATAVLSHAFWERRFAKDPGVVGRPILLNERPFTVVGVMPPRFEEITGGTDAYVPMGAYADLPWEQRGNGPGITAVGRLREGVSWASAAADLDRVGREVRERAAHMTATFTVRPLRTELLGDAEPALLVVTAAVGLVLLIACANVANLLLARGESRSRELAVRAAIGAGRGRLVRQLLTESVLLALVGGGLGVLLAIGGVRALRAGIPPNVPGAAHITVDGAVLLFTLGLSLLTGLVFGLVPALRASRTGADLAESLREGSRGSGNGRARQRLRGVLVTGEVALAVLLLVGAGLTARSFAALRAVDPGFEPAGVVTARVSPPIARYQERERWTGFYDALLERTRALPGVRGAALNTLVPLGGNSNETQVRPEGRSEDETESVLQMMVSPGYLRTMEIALVRGRAIEETDGPGAPLVAVIDEVMAEKFWPGEDPIGKRITFEPTPKPGRSWPGPGEEFDMANFDPQWRTVVGVVRNVRHYELQAPSRMQVYYSYRQFTFPLVPTMYLFAKSDGDPAQLTDALRRELRQLDPALPLFQVRSMEEVVGRKLAAGRLVGALLGFFGTGALVLAAIGIYGVISYTVVRRTREIGVRIALGAQPGDVVRMVVGGGGRLAFVGVVIGLAGAFALSRLIASQLYGVKPWDPATFIIVPLVLGAVALVAAWLPARRAARTDPALALAAE